MKLPKLQTAEDLVDLAGTEFMAPVTIGKIVVAMLRSREQVSRETIIAALEDVAAGKRQIADIIDVSAKGALAFIAGLPPS